MSNLTVWRISEVPRRRLSSGLLVDTYEVHHPRGYFEVTALPEALDATRPALEISGMTSRTCLYPDCCSTRRTRGLCHGHYQAMRSYVRKGTADEEDLEARGLLLPKGIGGGPRVGRCDAFLKGSDVEGEAS